jgi:hypothetical protein
MGFWDDNSQEWTHAPRWIDGTNDPIVQVTDPAGGKEKLLFDVHQWVSERCHFGILAMDVDLVLFNFIGTWTPTARVPTLTALPSKTCSINTIRFVFLR